jgi:2-dehydro-3-deoxyphosphooctonate aldolase (KDO 8-P synthase)
MVGGGTQMNIASLFQPRQQFFLIAGPCVLENDDLHQEIAIVLQEVKSELDLPVIFKASFDKANRSMPDAPRGPGLIRGLRMLETVRTVAGLPLITDIHHPTQAGVVGEICDVLQIPALLCRQTDLLVAAALTGRPINLKKGQGVGVPTMLGAVQKVKGTLARSTQDGVTLRAKGKDLNYPVAITERGTFFGYGDLVVDMRNIPQVQALCEVPVIFDATHSVQRPGRGQAGASGGLQQYIKPLARAAVAAGANGLFLEVHPCPEQAPSDGECMLRLDQLLPLMREIVALRKALLDTKFGL